MVLQQQIDQRESEERARQNNEMLIEHMRGVNLQNDEEVELKLLVTCRTISSEWYILIS